MNSMLPGIRDRRPTRSLILWLFALLLVGFTSATGQEWEPMNGPYGGGIVDLVTDGAGRIYAAREDNIFRTDDGGTSWSNVTDGAIGAAIKCLFVTPDGDIYAGVFSRGVYWSFDGGGSWDHDQITHDPHGGLGATILAIAVNANDVIFAGGFRSINHGGSWLELGFYGRAFAVDGAGDVYAGSSEGVRFSDDEGASWELRNTGMEGQNVRALALNSQGHLLAGTWAAGVFLSTDMGANWAPVNVGLPSLSVKALAIDELDRIYLALTDGALFQSTNSGATWQSLAHSLGGRGIKSLLTGPGESVWVGSQYHGSLRSEDQGSTWTELAAADMMLPDLADLATSPSSGDLYLAASGGGIYRSTNGGIDWQERNTGLPTTVVHTVASDATGRMYAGTDLGVFSSADSGAMWQPANVGHEGEAVVGLLVDANDAVVAILAESDLFFAFRVLRSTDGGTTWQQILDETFATIPTTASVWAIDTDGRLFIGGMSMATEGVIFVSEDDGATWQQTTIPFTNGTTGLAIGAGGRVYAPMGNNDLYVSDDHGENWTEIPNGGWPTGVTGRLDAAAVDQHDAVLVSSHGTGIWRSTDGGTNWSEYSEGLMTGVFPSVVFLKSAAGTLFAGTSNAGLFQRFPDLSAVEPDAVPNDRLQVSVTPNPFNPRTTIRYALSQDTPVRLEIFDLQGKHVRTLKDGIVETAGPHSVVWDGTDDFQRPVAAGVFLYRLRAGDLVESRKMTIVR